MKSPVKIRDIHKVEKESCISLNVFGHEKWGKISNLYIEKYF